MGQINSSFFTHHSDSSFFTHHPSLIDILHKEGCSLVLEDAQGNIRLFYKKGVRDLEDLLNNEPDVL